MNYRFENLKVWHQARDFCNSIYETTRHFPKEERFGLIDQLRRASLSIPLNIAEGSNRMSDLEFIRFLRIARGSACEVVTGLYIASDQKYIPKEKFEDLYQKSIKLSSRLTATIKSIQNT